jgi:hypothetical protein
LEAFGVVLNYFFGRIGAVMMDIPVQSVAEISKKVNQDTTSN